MLSVYEVSKHPVTGEDSTWAQYDGAGRAKAGEYVQLYLNQLLKLLPLDNRPDLVRLNSIIEMTATHEQSETESSPEERRNV